MKKIRLVLSYKFNFCTAMYSRIFLKNNKLMIEYSQNGARYLLDLFVSTINKWEWNNSNLNSRLGDVKWRLILKNLLQNKRMDICPGSIPN